MRKQSKPKTVDQYVAQLGSERQAVMQAIRKLVKQVFPQVEESISPWGGPTFALDGKELIWIGNYKNHTNFGFFHGSQLESPLLEGTGKNFRHIKIQQPTDIDGAELTRLLKAAKKIA